MINNSTIGHEANIILHGFNSNNIIKAKIDTGADMSSLHANDVKIKGNTVEFDFGSSHVNMPLSGYQSVKTADGGIENRPIVKFAVTIPKDGTDKDVSLSNVSFTLNDRTQMDDKVLLGLNFIEAGKLTIVSDAKAPKKITEEESSDVSKEEIIKTVLSLIKENKISITDLITLKEV